VASQQHCRRCPVTAAITAGFGLSGSNFRAMRYAQALFGWPVW
jgi:hypothetical protein